MLLLLFLLLVLFDSLCRFHGDVHGLADPTPLVGCASIVYICNLTVFFFTVLLPPPQLLLSVIPGVCSDLLRGYHNDWLGDVILIIYFTLR